MFQGLFSFLYNIYKRNVWHFQKVLEKNAEENNEENKQVEVMEAKATNSLISLSNLREAFQSKKQQNLGISPTWT